MLTNLIVRLELGSEGSRGFLNQKMTGFDFNARKTVVSLHVVSGRRTAGKWREGVHLWEGKKYKWMGVKVRVDTTNRFPLTQELAVGSVQVKDKTAQILMAKKWFYEMEMVTFADLDELVVFATGRTVFPVLRRLKLVPGRASCVGCSKFGVEWLREWRERKGCQKSESCLMSLTSAN